MNLGKIVDFMNQLETAIMHAFNASGAQNSANKVYLEFIKANFIIPIEKDSEEDKPTVLYLQEEAHTFLPVFTTRENCEQWAAEIGSAIKLLNLSGVDLIKGVGEGVTVCLNIGSPYYKEFNPDEIARMRSQVLKFWS